MFDDPYFVTDTSLPGVDFNREVIEPGTNQTFPEGAIGIRVDGDFWGVAALPYESYKDKPLQHIVAEFWPQYVGEAIYTPDSGTIEQTIYFLKQAFEHERHINRHLNDRLNELTNELDRFKDDKRDLVGSYSEVRRSKGIDYFVEQYENLLFAFAHQFEPQEKMKGLCKICNLSSSDRIHMKLYIDGKPNPNWDSDRILRNNT